jgi:hypothetical protein
MREGECRRKRRIETDDVICLSKGPIQDLSTISISNNVKIKLRQS